MILLLFNKSLKHFKNWKIRRIAFMIWRQFLFSDEDDEAQTLCSLLTTMNKTEKRELIFKPSECGDVISLLSFSSTLPFQPEPFHKLVVPPFMGVTEELN